MSAPRDALDPRALVRIRDLELRARTIVAGLHRGLHRSPLPGLSIEFTEYRPYAPGDDLRFLDWKRFARSDRPYVKRFEDETNLRCWFLVDASRSMEFGSEGLTKFEYARTLTATLAYLLLERHDAVGIARFAGDVERFVPARFRVRQWQHLLATLATEPTGDATDPVRSLEHFSRLVNRRGLVVLVSDCLTDPEGLERSLGMLRGRGQDLILLQLLDPREAALAPEDPYQVRDLETGRRIVIDPRRAAEEYRRRFEAHQRRLDEIAKRLGADRFVVMTDRPLDEALAAALLARSRRLAGRVLRRERIGGSR